jgi:hypothetical protein
VSQDGSTQLPQHATDTPITNPTSASCGYEPWVIPINVPIEPEPSGQQPAAEQGHLTRRQRLGTATRGRRRDPRREHARLVNLLIRGTGHPLVVGKLEDQRRVDILVVLWLA